MLFGMKNISPATHISVSERWNRLRDYFIDRILVGFLILVVIGLPISLSRAVTYGWQLVYVVQPVIAVSILFLYLYRRKLSVTFKAAVLITDLMILAVMGLGTFGLAGGGVPFFLLLQFMAASIYRPRVALFWLVFTFVVFVMIGLAIVSGSLSLQVDFNDYMTNLSAWGSVGIVFGVIGIVAFRAMGIVQHALLSLLQEVAEQRDEISHLANHDQLTGLPTMRLAQDRLEMAVHRAERHNQQVAVMFIDLDGFKKINDAFGHECGDDALREIAKRILQIVRADDTVARRSGDEFLVILESIADKAYVADVAARILAEISRPLPYKDISCTLGASIGISIYPDNGRDVQELERLADQAMYQVKHNQKNDFVFSTFAAP